MKTVFINRVLDRLCALYEGEHGETKRFLHGWVVDFAIFTEDPKLKKIVDKYYSPQDHNYEFGWIIDELESRGYVKNSSRGYHLTIRGYELGTQGRTKRMIEIFNQNPGIATVVAIIALFVSRYALYVSSTKP